LKDGTKIQCVEPPPDVVASGVRANAEVAATKVGNLLKGTGGVGVDIERIRQEVPSDVSSFEVIEYRICTQYGNGVLTKEEYRTFTDRILPAIKKQLSQLVVEGADDRLSLIPQDNQPLTPKVTKFARIKVLSLGEDRVTIERMAASGLRFLPWTLNLNVPTHQLHNYPWILILEKTHFLMLLLNATAKHVPKANWQFRTWRTAEDTLPPQSNKTSKN
jgi:hypothetical protein